MELVVVGRILDTLYLYMCDVCFHLVLLQRGADSSIRNTDGKTALDLADPLSKSVLTGTVMFEISILCCSLG